MSEIEIGVWVEGAQKWVSGVSRRTSCYDVIKALLKAQSLPADDSDVTKHVIVERWRKVERPLDHEQRILKVWKTWGETINEVKFTLRRVKPDNGFDSDTGSRIERSRRRQRWRQMGARDLKTGSRDPKTGARDAKLEDSGHTMKLKSHSHETKENKPEEKSKQNETMERLMRLVVAQGETIQTQLRRMQERDTQIENFEHQLHLLRVQNIGSDYLLQSYLREPVPDINSLHGPEGLTKDELLEEKSNDSGVVTEEINDSDAKTPSPEKTEEKISKNSNLELSEMEVENVEELQEKSALLEKLESVLIGLVEHEVAILTLERSLTACSQSESARLQEEIAESAVEHANIVASSRQNEVKLRELDIALYQNKRKIDSICEEETKCYEEAKVLQSRLDYIINLPPAAFQNPVRRKPLHTDSRSLSPNRSRKKLCLTLKEAAKDISRSTQTNLNLISNVPPQSYQNSINRKSLFNKSCRNNLRISQSLLDLSKLDNNHKPFKFDTSYINKIENKFFKNNTRVPCFPALHSSDKPALTSILKTPLHLAKLNSPLHVTKINPPPLPSTSPPPLDDDDDKDSGKTGSFCVSSRSSTSSTSSDITACEHNLNCAVNKFGAISSQQCNCTEKIHCNTSHKIKFCGYTIKNTESISNNLYECSCTNHLDTHCSASKQPLNHTKKSLLCRSQSSSTCKTRVSAQNTSSEPISSSNSGTRSQSKDDGDTNSDTGLSSLHSSSDEGQYVLDTLV